MSYELERPEAFLGTLIAFEGVRDSMSIIHGPTGCKMYPADLSERLFVGRKDDVQTRNTFLMKEKYFFYQPRLPCTLLDGSRLIMGASERLDDLYSIVVREGPGMIGIVNSPGASLTGENLDRCVSDIPTIKVDSHEFSKSMFEGFGDCSVRIIDGLCTGKDVKKGTVNIFGLSIWHLNFEEEVEELTRILSMCGIEVNCFLCAGSTVDEIRRIPSAELNIVVDRDFGLRAAEHCRERFGTDYVVASPIGFDSTERMIDEVCSRLGKDPAAALEDSRIWRRKAAKRISIAVSRYVRISGRTFSVHSTPCIADSVAAFILDYIGIVPVAVQHDGLGDDPDLGVPVSDDIWNDYADIIYGSSNEIAAMVERNLAAGGVCICDPDSRPVNIFPRPLMGTLGAVRLVEDTLNVLFRITDRL